MPTREEMRSLAEEIVGAYTDRVATIAELGKTVKTELKESKDARIDLGKELRADLAKSAADCKRGVSVMFRGFGQVHASMSKKMRADLDKGVADRKGEVDNMLKGFSAELKEIRSEIAGGGEQWQTLTTTMQSKRGGVGIKVKPLIGAITPETTTLRNRVFEYLANHPDGTKMTKLEQEFSVARIQMAKLLKDLADENKVAKRNSLYFAI